MLAITPPCVQRMSCVARARIRASAPLGPVYVAPARDRAADGDAPELDRACGVGPARSTVLLLLSLLSARPRPWRALANSQMSFFPSLKRDCIPRHGTTTSGTEARPEADSGAAYVLRPARQQRPKVLSFGQVFFSLSPTSVPRLLCARRVRRPDASSVGDYVTDTGDGTKWLHGTSARGRQLVASVALLARAGIDAHTYMQTQVVSGRSQVRSPLDRPAGYELRL